MYTGKHSAQASAKPENRPVRSAAPRRRVGSARKNMGLIVALALILSIAVGGTVAWLTSNVSISNSMVPGKVPVTINETFKENNTVKDTISLTNTGNVQALLRVAIVGNSINSNGEVIPNTSNREVPVVNNENHSWKLIGGYYYYNGIVEPNETVPFIADSDVPFAGAEVVVMAQTVQYLGTFTEGTASQKLWGHTYDPISNSWT